MKFMFKRLLSFLLVIPMLFLAACGTVHPIENDDATGSKEENPVNQDPGSDAITTSNTPYADDPNQYTSLNNKSVLFIGNSFIWYGQTVLEKKATVLEQSDRDNDHGYFFQLCKSMGERVSVTNWTYGGHSLQDLFGGDCHANRGCDHEDHLSYLTDRNFDYVVISAGSGTNDDEYFEQNLDQIMSVFRAANPEVRFVYLCNAAAHGIRSAEGKMTHLLNSLKNLDDKNVTVVDWGGLITDIIDGTAVVPGAKLPYYKNTFIIQKSAVDGYHPNLLTGYLTSLMAYCAITGRSAVGLDYSFCGNPIIHTKFDFAAFEKANYSYNGATSNFRAVFASEADMKGLQILVDRYLADCAYRYYNF